MKKASSRVRKSAADVPELGKEMRNGKADMIVEIRNDRPAIVREDGSAVLTAIYTGSRYWGSTYNVLKSYGEQRWSVRESDSFSEKNDFSVLGERVRYFIAECADSRLYAALTNRQALLRTEYRNSGAATTPDTVISLGGIYENRLERAMYHGVSCDVGVMDMNSKTDIMRFVENGFCESAVHMPIVDCSGQALNLGFVTFDRYYGRVFAREDGSVEFRHIVEKGRLEEGERISSDWMLLSFYEDMVEELPAYSRFVKEFNRFENRYQAAPVGFCSWYYYMENINERMITENLETIDRIRDRVPMEVFQIDSGWGYGNQNGAVKEELFPKGMKAYAELIRSHGLRPGIWLSPFDFEQDGETVQSHPEWFIQDDEGRMILHGNCAMLDATHPGAQAYIRELYRKLTYDWGYRYLKIDIVTHFMTRGHYYDPKADSLTNVRKYFQLAREASHPDTYLLGCTCPLFEIAEFVDGSRISVDIFERWESLVKAFDRVFKRYYMNEELFLSDADCLMVRKRENEDGDCRRNCTRTDEEIRTFLTAMYAAGGALFFSDKLRLLTKEQIEQYAALFPRSMRAGRPLDLMESWIPGIIDQGYEGDTRTVALINWGEREKCFTVSLAGTHHAKEHWTGEDLGTCTDTFEATLQPHCSLLLHFTKI